MMKITAKSDYLTSEHLRERIPVSTCATTMNSEMSALPIEDTLVSQFRRAVYSHDPVSVKVITDQGLDINVPDRNGETFLHCAAADSHTDIVRELITAGADVNAKNLNGQTSLHIAASRGYDLVVQHLLESGGSLFEQTYCSGMTALHLASLNGHASVVQTLLDYNADVNTKDQIEKIPEYYAATDEVRQIFQNNRLQFSMTTTPVTKTFSSTEDITKNGENGMDLEDVSTVSETSTRSNNMKSPTFLNSQSHSMNQSDRKGQNTDNGHKKHTFAPKQKTDKKLTDHKFNYSNDHKKRMRMNVFDRLTKANT